MKKLNFLFVIAIFSFTSLNAQGVFKLGANVGIPAADASDYFGFTIGVDAYYMLGKEDALFNFGPTAGFRNFFAKSFDFGGESIKGDDGQFLPLAGAARIKLVGILNAGADIGYAVGINSGNDGGFYFRPIVGIDIADTIEINVSYESITKDSVTWGNINAGILFEF